MRNKILISLIALGVSANVLADKPNYIAAGCGSILEVSNVESTGESGKKAGSLNGIEAIGILGGVGAVVNVIASSVISLGYDAFNASKASNSKISDPDKQIEVMYEPDNGDKFKIILQNQEATNAVTSGARVVVLASHSPVYKNAEPTQVKLLNISALPNKGKDYSCFASTKVNNEQVNLEVVADPSRDGGVVLSVITDANRNLIIDEKRSASETKALIATKAMYRKMWVRDGAIDYAAIRAYADDVAIKYDNLQGSALSQRKESLHSLYLSYVEEDAQNADSVRVK